MINLKNITELPVAESTDGLNLIVNDNGAAKQVAASAVGAQADWAVTDESNPAFIKNKPVIPEGFSGSWNDLKDKPFDSKTETYTIFNNVNLVNDNGGSVAYIYSESQCEYNHGADIISFIIDGVTYTPDNYFYNDEDQFHYISVDVGDGEFSISHKIYDNGDGIHWYGSGKVGHTMSVILTREIIHKLDAKYLPPTYDFVIVANNDYTAELVVGDYDTIYNKLINGEFVDGRVIVYYWTGDDESTNHFSISRTFSEFEIELGVDGNDVPCIHFEFMNNGLAYYCSIRNDNSVFYWSVD